MLDNKVILVTGGTGSFGEKFAHIVLSHYKLKKLIIFSRDEFKQDQMRKNFPYENIRFFLGDIRDKQRLYTAFNNVNYVVHAAALKQIPALEYNPIEAVRTNIDGAENIIHAAIQQGVEKVIALSSDKAVNPVNLYGATKMAAEKLFLAANAYSGEKVQFSIVRYGNVVGSRGSVIPYFISLKKQGIKEFPITSPYMTRFWLSKGHAVRIVINMLLTYCKGEIWIPQIPSMKITDVARAINPKCKFNIIGVRKGEKLHETLISKEEGTEYRSDRNTAWLTKKGLWRLINEDSCDYPGKAYVYKISP